MKRFVKWLAAIAAGLAVVLAAVAVALQYWVRSDDFRLRLSQQISAALGVPVQLGRVSVDVWPLPAVALDQVQLQSRPPLTLERIEARPAWAGLLQGRLQIATLVVRNAVVPEQGVSAIAAAFRKTHDAAPRRGPDDAGAAIGLLPRRTVLDHVTWVHAKGGSTTVDAQAQLDPDGKPAAAQVEVLKGRFQGAKATVQRQPDHWALRAAIGGGTVTGKLQLQSGAKGASRLQGQLDAANVEVAALTAPNRTLTGRLEAHTTLHAEFRELGALADAVQSQTRFTVHNAVVHGIDLAQAAKSVGLSRGGETRLDTLAGNVATQGRAVQLTNLVATSGLLSANGSVAIAPNRSLDGRITVDLASAAAGGAIGVPLAVGGTLDSPSVMLTRGALLGAAVGTVLAPGVGTGAGAKLGDQLGEGLRGLFGK
ncbi:MAG TPA: AsmA family protein [Ramlibacter sp.]|nr:AsmA family protein [Ramlibacter sp.]